MGWGIEVGFELAGKLSLHANKGWFKDQRAEKVMGRDLQRLEAGSAHYGERSIITGLVHKLQREQGPGLELPL